MPYYLFTLHAYRSWMPDRERGYVERGEGVLPQDILKAEEYAQKALEEAVQFGAGHQQCMIDAILVSYKYLQARCHGVATDSSHIHVLISWEVLKTWEKMRASVRGSMTRALNNGFERRTWFSESGSRKRVKDREHFDHLMGMYFPGHRGVRWFENQE